MHNSDDDLGPKVARDVSSGHVSRHVSGYASKKRLNLRRPNGHLVAGVQTGAGVGLTPSAGRSRVTGGSSAIYLFYAVLACFC